jgi:hypothetical protein
LGTLPRKMLDKVAEMIIISYMNKRSSKSGTRAPDAIHLSGVQDTYFT